MPLSDTHTSEICARILRSEGLCASCHPAPATKGNVIMTVTENVQNQGCSNTIQPSSNNSSKDTGSRLRRRLSIIFHRDKRDNLLGLIAPPATVTKGSIQAPICQSPLIQRCRRFISAAYCEGLSSYTSTSLSRPERV